jgi:hypothetical protein
MKHIYFDMTEWPNTLNNAVCSECHGEVLTNAERNKVYCPTCRMIVQDFSEYVRVGSGPKSLEDIRKERENGA